jgi:hypothetical protein
MTPKLMTPKLMTPSIEFYSKSKASTYSKIKDKNVLFSLLLQNQRTSEPKENILNLKVTARPRGEPRSSVT